MCKISTKNNAFAELAGPLCFVGALVFSFGKLLSYFFLVVGRETHGLFCSAASRVDGTCACVNLNGIMITSLHSTRTSVVDACYIDLLREGVATQVQHVINGGVWP